MTDEHYADGVVGALGVVIVATRGDAGPGEVSLRLAGATDAYLAWSAEPLPRGTEVVVSSRRGPRTVEVDSVDDLAAPPATPDNTPASSIDPLLDL